jgi:hypothetical protein
MGLVATFPMQGLQPSRYRDRAIRGGVALPWGGPTGAGSDYLQGSALTLVGGTAQPEIWTLTLSGSGTFVLQFVAEAPKQTAPLSVTGLTNTQLLAALQTIWPTWVLPSGSVTGSAGGPFTITFGGTSGYGGGGGFSRIGGGVNFITTGSASAALVRTQRGSVGAGQYDLADGVTNLTFDAALVDQWSSGVTGDLTTIPYGPVNDTTATPWAWIEGFFLASDVPNLTNGIVAASFAKVTFYLGNSVAQPGAEIRLTQ